MKAFHETSTCVTLSILDRTAKAGERPALRIAEVAVLKLLHDGVDTYFIGDDPKAHAIPTSLTVYIPNEPEKYDGYSFVTQPADFLRPMLVGWEWGVGDQIKATTIYDDMLPAFDVMVVVTQLYGKEPSVMAKPSAAAMPPAQWQPTHHQLVRVDGARGIYRIEDIDVYEGNFILSEADSSRRHRSGNLRSNGSFGAGFTRDDNPYIGGIPVPFDKVKPFYLPL